MNFRVILSLVIKLVKGGEFMNKKTLGGILILIGVIIIGITGYLKYDSFKKEKDMREKFESALKNLENKSENGEKEKSPEGKGDDDKVEALGVMIIPKINMKAAIGSGTEEKVLNYYLGHFENTAFPGENGNFSVAGHRNYVYNEFFRDVDKLENGDEILVRAEKGEFKYKVDKSFVVNPEDIYVLDKTEDATITLVTCTTDSKRRLIVKGTLVKE